MTITKEEVQKLLDRMTFECVNCEMDHALAEDIGKTLIAESARADQAEAAMAAMVERCAEAVTPQDVYGDGRYFRVPGFHQAGCAYKDNDLVAAANIAVERIRALADIDGLALVRELRDRAEKAEADRVAEWNKRRDADGSRDAARAACETMRIERDTLAASLAASERREKGLREALANLIARYDEVVTTPDCSCGQDDHDVMKARAALATQEAGNAQSTPPISPEEAQFNAVRYHERFGPLDEKGNPVDPRRRG